MIMKNLQNWIEEYSSVRVDVGFAVCMFIAVYVWNQNCGMVSVGNDICMLTVCLWDNYPGTLSYEGDSDERM